MSFAERLGAALVLLFLCPTVSGADSDGKGEWKGQPLNDYIESLQRAGLRIIYSTDLVLDEYRVQEEPSSQDPKSALREALAPYGLVLESGPAGSTLITTGEPTLPVDETVAKSAEPEPTPLPEIIVTSSLYNIRYEHPGSHRFLDRDLATRMPDLGDEALRAVARLPGTSGGGISTRNHIRGGVQNEQLFLFDGLRLYEPYHMKDFQSIATTVDQNVMAGIDIYSAGYQARYGDRMSGVVSISLREPPVKAETELALSFFNTSAVSRGRFGGNDRGDWLVSGRRANLDVLIDVIDPDYGSPRYQDYLAHVGWELGDHTYLSANTLFSFDKISLSQADGSEQANAKYQNFVFWMKAESTWTDRVETRTILSATEIENRRTGTSEIPDTITGFVDDERKFRSLALKQDWEYHISDRWLVSSGFELKRLEADYRYHSSRVIFAPFDQILDNEPSENRSIDVAPRGSQYAVYSELRWRVSDQVTLDAGLRWDQQTYTSANDDRQLSPRFNLLWRLSDDTELRFAYGEYYQAQEINELQVSDGESSFYPVQRAQHLVASLMHSLHPALDFRFEIYQKKYNSLMPRFENIFNPLVLIPELQIDRARIDAVSAVAEGMEVTVGGEGSDELVWWASYSWSRTEDTLQNESTKRSWDQTHALSAGLSREWRKWNFSVAAVLHTGWPKTVLITETIPDPDGSTSLVAAVEPRNSRRHAVFQSLDARVSRRFDVSKGDLTAFLEVTNLSNRKNPCCTEYSAGLVSDGNAFVQAEEGYWLPLVPSLGIVWRF